MKKTLRWLGCLLLFAAAAPSGHAATKEEEEFFRRYAIPTLVEREVDQRVRMAIFTSFVQLFSSPPAPESLSEKDLARTLAELDRLAQDAGRSLGFSLSGQEWRVKELFFKPGPGFFSLPERAEDPPIAAPQAAAAAADFVREVVGTARLPAYQEVLDLFARQQLQLASRAHFRSNPRGAVERLDENFRMQRELLAVLAESPVILRVLPNGEELQALRKLAQANRDRARASPALIPRGIEQAVGLTAQAVISDASFGYSAEKLDAWRAPLAALKGRVEALMDKSRTPACRERSLDVKSVHASKGDWTSVRTKDGQPILPGSPEHAEMSTIYRLGCGGPRDFPLARKVMEEVAAAPSSADGPGFAAPPDARYCGLAQWKRNGIGGPRDEQGAQELEQRFRAKWRYSCRTGSMVDPDDPWDDQP